MMMVLVQRMVRRPHVDAVRVPLGQVRAALESLPGCGSRDALMGVEGAAARAYFAALSHLVPEDLRFAGRSRRPPLDVVNAALSYGYSILLGEVVSALCAAGLDPAIGFLHVAEDNRPSLALDLMEEFRPMVVDQAVISAIRRGELCADHARQDAETGGVLLSKQGRGALVTSYERRMVQMTRSALPGFAGSLRRHLYRQAERLAAYVHDPGSTWSGLSWR